MPIVPISVNRQITAHLWHVNAGDVRLGWVRRVFQGTRVAYFARRDRDGHEEACLDFESAIDVIHRAEQPAYDDAGARFSLLETD